MAKVTGLVFSVVFSVSLQSCGSVSGDASRMGSRSSSAMEAPSTESCCCDGEWDVDRECSVDLTWCVIADRQPRFSVCFDEIK
ncbi:ORFL206W [Human betaherpesvirus 5]|nr:ORFL206W [Human betaherpesvirus 5]QHX40560.1 ORFL206W [Human betaherpesvirus 5]